MKKMMIPVVLIALLLLGKYQNFWQREKYS